MSVARDQQPLKVLIFTFVTAALLINGCGGDNNSSSVSTPNPPPVSSTPSPITPQQFLYVANTGSGDISGFSINASTGALTQIAGSPFVFASPVVMTTVTGGRLLVAQEVSSTTTSSGLGTFTIDRTTGALVPPASSAPLTVVTPAGVAPGTGQFQAGQFLTRDATGTFVYVSGFTTTTTTTGTTGTTGTTTPGVVVTPGSIGATPGTGVPGAPLPGITPGTTTPVGATPQTGVPGAPLPGITPGTTTPGTVTPGTTTTPGSVTTTPVTPTPGTTTTGAITTVGGTSGPGTPSIGAFSVDSSGTFTLLSGSPNVFILNGVPATPGPLAFDPAGKFLYAVLTSCSSAINCVATNGLAAIVRNADGSLGNLASGSPIITGADTQASSTDTCFAPDSIAVHTSGSFVYVACPGDGPNGRIFGIQVFRVDTNGLFTLVQTFGDTGNANDQPTAIAVDPAGKVLLVARAFRNSVSVLAIDAATGVLSETVRSPFTAGAGPNAIAFDTSGQFVYVTNGGLLSGTTAGITPSNDISTFSLNTTTGVLTPVQGSPFVAGTGPRSPIVAVP